MKDEAEPDLPKRKQQVVQGILQHYIHAAHNQYIDYIQDKILSLRKESYVEPNKITLFKIRLME